MKKITLLIFFIFSALLVDAQIKVVATKASATYYGSEAIEFTVSGVSGNVQYKFGYAGDDTGGNEITYIDESPTSVFETGTINVPSGGSLTFTPNFNNTSKEEGPYICEVSKNGQTSLAIAFYNPFDVQPFESEPSDFESFWISEVNATRNISPNFSFTSSGDDTGDFFGPSTTYSFKIKSTTYDMHGYITIPGGSGTFPAIIKFPPFSAVPSPRIQEANRNKVISISLNIYQNINSANETGTGSVSDGLDDKSTFYYKHVILGAIKLIDYLESGVNPTIKFDTNSKVGLYGDSQGGGLALVVGGLDQFINGSSGRVGAISVSNPAQCEHHGFTQTPKKASGFPNWLANHGSVNNIQQNVKYYDAVNFTKRFNKPTFMTVGYRDRTCPTSTNLAALNQTKSNTILFSMRDTDHSHPYQEWDDDKVEFFKQYLDNSIQSSTTGYHINAGADKNISSNSTSLNGVIQKNGSNISLATKWEKVSGPGSVSFSPSTSVNTQATFSANGTYVLRLRAQDDYTLFTAAAGFEDKSFYTLVDYITVQVGSTSGCNLSISNPSSNQFSLNSSGDSFTFTVNGNSGSSWSISDNASWVTLSPSSGNFSSGSQTITATINSNSSSNSRNAIITATCGGSSQSINITQSGSSSNSCNITFTNFSESSANPGNFTCGQGMKTYDLTFTSSVNNGSTEIIIEDVPSSQYLGAIPSHGTIQDIYPNGSRALKWTLPSINTSTTYDMKASFCYVSSSQGPAKATSSLDGFSCDKLSGPGTGCTLSASATTVSIPQGGGSQQVTISGTSSSILANSNNPAFSASVSGNTITISAGSNNNTSTQSATITVTGGGCIPLTILVSQTGSTGCTLSSSNSNVTISSGGGSQQVTISGTSSTLFASSSNPAFSATVSGNNLTISAGANNNSSTKSGTVTITGGGCTQVVVNVSQSGSSGCNIDFISFNESATNPNGYSCGQGIRTYNLSFTSSTNNGSTEIIIEDVPSSQYLGAIPSHGTVQDIYPNGSRALKWTLPSINTNTTYSMQASFCYVSSSQGFAKATSPLDGPACDVLSGSGGCTLSSSNSNVSISSGGGSQQVTISGTSSTLFASSSNPTFSATVSGSNVTISAGTNNNSSTESGAVTITGGGCTPVVINVTQAGSSSCNIDFFSFDETTANPGGYSCGQGIRTYDLSFTSSNNYGSREIIIEDVPGSQYLGATANVGTVVDIYSSGSRALKWTLPSINTTTTYNMQATFCYVSGSQGPAKATSPEDGPACDVTSGTSNFSVPNLINFSVVKKGISSKVNWVMNSEEHINFYELEVSNDGVNFELLEEITAARLNSSRAYEMMDLNPSIGENFYRLKISELDGTIYYSNIRRVNFDIDFQKIILFPNPSSDYVNIMLRDFTGMKGNVEIFNSLGQKMDERKYISFPTIPVQFDVNTYQDGIYTISIKVDNYRTFTKRFVVNKL